MCHQLNLTILALCGTISLTAQISESNSLNYIDLTDQINKSWHIPFYENSGIIDGQNWIYDISGDIIASVQGKGGYITSIDSIYSNGVGVFGHMKVDSNGNLNGVVQLRVPNHPKSEGLMASASRVSAEGQTLYFDNLNLESGEAITSSSLRIRIPSIFKQALWPITFRLEAKEKLRIGLPVEQDFEYENVNAIIYRVSDLEIITILGAIDKHGNGFGSIADVYAGGRYTGEIKNWRGEGAGFYENNFQRVEGQFTHNSLLEGKLLILNANGNEIGSLRGTFDQWLEDGGNVDLSTKRHVEFLIHDALNLTENNTPKTNTVWCSGVLIEGEIFIGDSLIGTELTNISDSVFFAPSFLSTTKEMEYQGVDLNIPIIQSMAAQSGSPSKIVIHRAENIREYLDLPTWFVNKKAPNYLDKQFELFSVIDGADSVDIRIDKSGVYFIDCIDETTRKMGETTVIVVNERFATALIDYGYSEKQNGVITSLIPLRIGSKENRLIEFGF